MNESVIAIGTSFSRKAGTLFMIALPPAWHRRRLIGTMRLETNQRPVAKFLNIVRCNRAGMPWLGQHQHTHTCAVALKRSPGAVAASARHALARVGLQKLGTFPVWRFLRTPPLMPGLRADFAPCSRPQPPAAAHCLLKLARGVIAASAPEQREQDDDRKGNSEYPQQQAATEAHHVLLWVCRFEGAASDGSRLVT